MFDIKSLLNITSTDDRHIVSLNLLRGIAALSVCFFHIFSGNTFNSLPWLKFIISKGYLGVDLFFIISGFIIPYSMYQNKYSLSKFPQFLLKRSTRIEPPYIISFLLIIGIRLIQSYTHGFQYFHDWNKFWLHFFYLNRYLGYGSYSSIYWTLAIEFQFYVLMGFLFSLIIDKRKIVSFSLLLIFGSFSWFLNLQHSWFIFQYGYLFIAGVIIFLWKIRKISAEAFLALISSVLALLFFKNGLEAVIVSLIFLIAVFSIKRKMKVPEFFGKISYSLYLTHLEIAGCAMLYLGAVITNDLLLRGIALLFAVIFATVFYFLFEKPSLGLSKKIKYKSKH